MFLPHKNKEIKAAHLFHNLALSQSRHYSRIVRVNGELCYLSGQKTFDRDGKLNFLILVSFNKPEGSQKDYAQRWQIEMCYRSMKSSGFDMEKTHLQKIERIEKLVLLVMVAFVWCYKVGIFLHQNIKQIPIKKHGRKAKSIFKYGLDYLMGLFLNALNQDVINVFSFLVTIHPFFKSRWL